MFLPMIDVDQAFADMNALRRRMDALLGTPGLDGRHGLRTAQTVLPFSVEESDDAFTLTADLPGVARDGLELEVEARQLSLKVHRDESLPEGAQLRHRERRTSTTLARTITLPRQVDADAIEARLEHGVLTVRLPKVAETAPRRITVQG